MYNKMHLLTVKQAAEYLNMSVDILYRLARKGDVPSVKIGGSVRFPRQKLDEFIDSQVAG